jgi:hypothetical protein
MHDAGDTGRTRADTPPNPSRRGLLTGSTAAALVAGAAAVTAVAAPGASVPQRQDADGPDAELIRLCDRLTELTTAERTIIMAQHTGATAMAAAALADAPLQLDGSISPMDNAEWLAFGAVTFLAGQQGAEGPSARKRTVASCTQCPGPGEMRQCAVDPVRNRRHAITHGSVLHAKSSPALGPRFAACNTPTAAATSRPFRLARHDCTQ